MSSLVVKRGDVHVKEEGLRSFLWSRKWVVLREQTLTMHRNEHTYQALTLIFLREITQVNRCELKPYCIQLETVEKTYYLQLQSDDDLYAWMDAIYLR
jgi:protein-serine/threonine kinase